MQKIILTIGDANGIGPEIVAKFLTSYQPVEKLAIEVVGCTTELFKVAENLKLELPETNNNFSVNYLNTEGHSIGETSYIAIEHAVSELALERAAALVTGPISKAQLQQAGLNYTGHTEILEMLACDLYRSNYVAEMIFEYQQFLMLLLTRHIPLIQVESALTKARVLQALKTLRAYLEKPNNLVNNQVAVMGLNPHAGEIGGDTEQKILSPMIEQLNQTNSNINFVGPFAADGLMRGINPTHPDYLAYVSCYHDQGLIPMKLLAGYEAVNITIGLPFIRTSVSHGTAPDIVGLNKANSNSLTAAVHSAIRQTKLSPKMVMAT